MRKFILALFIAVAFVPLARATDWSRYDSKFDNLYITGYKTQPGYVAFQDKAGNVQGYLFVHDNGELYWQCKTAGTPTRCVTGIDLTTTKLGTVGGEIRVINP